jgi:hypothetical protein
MIMRHVNEDEIVACCQTCGRYFEIWEKEVVRSGQAGLLFCKDPSCGVVACFYCKNEVCGVIAESVEAHVEATEAAHEHFACAQMASEKLAIESALALGQKMLCPSCKIGGRKDDACMHMTCMGCSTVWCYFCGLSEDNADKAQGDGRSQAPSIFAHNANWQENLGCRCPMYLTEICEFDSNWPEEEDECLDYFHRIKSLTLLRAELNRIGREKFCAVFAHFASLSNCGFSLGEIETAELTLVIPDEVSESEGDDDFTV